MALWYDESYADRVRLGLKVSRTLHTSRSEFQRVEILETEHLGRVLVLDGIFQTSEGDEYFYHEMLTHPALCTAASIREVLIIGGGDGGTAREVLRHPEVEHVVLCEIDRQVVEACQEHLPAIGAWSDPRLELVFADGMQYVQDQEEDCFDVVLVDGSDPVGPSEGLFNTEFYTSVHRVLRPSGVFALQSESPIEMPEVFLDIVNRLRRIFRRADPYFGPVPLYASGIWSWTFCGDSVEPLAVDPTRATRAEATSRYYNRDIHGAAFALPQFLKRALA
jgi:spermidine synthase